MARNTTFAALSIVFGTLGRLRFWPGDTATAFGNRYVYARLVGSGYHVVTLGDRAVLCPPESLDR